MFSYLLSVAICFIVLGVAFNIVKKIEPDWYDTNLNDFGWAIIFCTSFCWFLIIPAIFIGGVIFLLKLLTDKLAELILTRVEKRKLKLKTESKLEK